MSDISQTTRDLVDLQSVTKDVSIQFSQFSESLLDAATGTGKASKQWNNYSRILTGTALWKVQNYFRGALGFFQNHRESVNDGIKALQKQRKEQVESIKKFKDMNKAVLDTKARFGSFVDTVIEGTNVETIAQVVGKQARELELSAKRQSAYNERFFKNQLGEYRKQLERFAEEQRRVNESLGVDFDAESFIGSRMAQLQKGQEEEKSLAENIVKSIRKQKEDLQGFYNEVRESDTFVMARQIGKSETEAFVEAYKKIMAGAVNAREANEKLVNSMQVNEMMKTTAGRTKLREQQKAQVQSRRRGLLEEVGGIPAGFFVQLTKDLQNVGKFLGFTRTDEERATGNVISRPLQKLTIKYQQGMINLRKKLTPFLDLGMKYLIIGLFAMIGLIAFMASVQTILEEMSFLNVMEQVQGVVGLVVEGINLLVGFVGALVNNDLDAAMEYLGGFIDVAFETFLKLSGVLLSAGLALIIGTLRGLPKLLFDDKYRGVVLNILGKFLIMYMTAYFVRYLAIKLMELAAIYALPVLIGVALGLVLFALLMPILKRLGMPVSNNAPRLNNQGLFTNPAKFRATGGLVNENLTVVGENGPELVSLPTGSKVHTNTQTKKMMGNTNTFNITINARDTSDAELRRIASKIGSMVNNSINRTTSSRTLG